MTQTSKKAGTVLVGGAKGSVGVATWQHRAVSGNCRAVPIWTKEKALCVPKPL